MSARGTDAQRDLDALSAARIALDVTLARVEARLARSEEATATSLVTHFEACAAGLREQSRDVVRADLRRAALIGNEAWARSATRALLALLGSRVARDEPVTHPALRA